LITPSLLCGLSIRTKTGNSIEMNCDRHALILAVDVRVKVDDRVRVDDRPVPEVQVAVSLIACLRMTRIKTARFQRKKLLSF